MTKKNATKRAARALQEKLGGKYMHHRRVASGEPSNAPSRAKRKLSMEAVLALAQEQAPAAVEEAHAGFNGAPYVYVAGDASEPFGAVLAATCRANTEGIAFRAALGAIKEEAAQRPAKNGNLPYGGLLKVDDFGKILRKLYKPAKRHVVDQLVVRFSTPAPDGHFHVFATAEKEVLASLVEVEDRWHRAYEEAAVGRLLHDESEADEDGFIAGAGFDRYGGFEGDGLS